MAETDLCRCGHYRREHAVTEIFQGLNLATCSGNTRAWPDDAEGDHEGREVSCQCLGFEAADV